MENIKRQQQIWIIISIVMLVVVCCAVIFSLNFLYEKFLRIKKYEQELVTYKINTNTNTNTNIDVSDLTVSLSERIFYLEDKLTASMVQEEIFYELAQNIKIQDITIFENPEDYDIEINFLGDEKSVEYYVSAIKDHFIKSELVDMNINLASEFIGGNLYFKIFK